MFFGTSPAIETGTGNSRTKENYFNFNRIGYTTIAQCVAPASAKTAILAEISRGMNISFACILEDLYFNTAQLKAFANGATNLSIHFDLSDGNGNTFITDLFTPLDVVTAVATPQTGSVPKFIHVEPIIDGAVANDPDIAILSHWSAFSLSNIMHANNGANDKGTVTQKIVDAIKNTGYFSTGYASVGTVTPFAPTLILRVVSTATLTCINKSLAIFAKIGLTTGLKDILGNG